MATYVFYTATGVLYSWSPSDTDPVAPATILAANGMSAVSGLAPLDPTHSWDPATKTVVVVTAPVTPKWIPTYQFILLFTPAEHAAIQDSTDQKVQQFMMAVSVAQQVNLNDPVVQGAVNYLVTVGLLTQPNATLILSGRASQ